MNYREHRHRNQRGFIPVPILIVLLIVAAVGGGLVGFFMGQGIQGVLIAAAVAVVLTLVVINLPGAIRWFKSLKKEAKRK